MKWKGILSVIGGLLIHLTLGTVYTAGNMNPYMTSYTRAYSSPQDMNYEDGTWIFAVGTMGQGLSMFVGGLISNKIGPRWTTLLGGWFMSLGVMLTRLTITVSFPASMATYGVMFGLGIGIAYAPPLAVGMQWFPNHKGLVNGVIVGGFGGGALIFNQIQTFYINPLNKSPDEPSPTIPFEKYFSNTTAPDVLQRVPNCFVVIGVCYMVLQLIGSLLMFTPPGSKNDKSDDDSQKYLLKETSNGSDVDDDRDQESMKQDSSYFWVNMVAEDMSVRKVLRTRAFYTLWVMFFVNGQAVVFISSLYKAYGQTFIKDDHFLTLLGSIASLCNALGRPMWGHLADRFSFKVSMMSMCVGMIIFMMTLVSCSYGGKVMFFIWVNGIYLMLSGNYALFPTAAAKSFGTTNVAVVHGCIFTSQVATAPLGAILASNLAVMIGWFGMFCLVSAFSFIGFILALSFNVKTKRGNNI